MHYRQIRPSATVEQHVEFYWMLEASSITAYVQRVIPDGRAGIVLNCADPFDSHSNGIWKSQPECFFVGQITGPLLLRSAGPAKMIGIQFRPNGAAHLLGFPISELTDTAIALDDLQQGCFGSLSGFGIWLRRCNRSKPSIRSCVRSPNEIAWTTNWFHTRLGKSSMGAAA